MSNKRKRSPQRPARELSEWSADDRRMAAAIIFCTADLLEAAGIRDEPCLEAPTCSPALATPTCVFCALHFTMTKAQPNPAVQGLLLSTFLPDGHVTAEELVGWLRGLGGMIAGPATPAAGTAGA